MPILCRSQTQALRKNPRSQKRDLGHPPALGLLMGLAHIYRCRLPVFLREQNFGKLFLLVYLSDRGQSDRGTKSTPAMINPGQTEMTIL